MQVTLGIGGIHRGMMLEILYLGNGHSARKRVLSRRCMRIIRDFDELVRVHCAPFYCQTDHTLFT